MKISKLITILSIFVLLASCEEPESLHRAVYTITQVEPLTVIAEAPPVVDPPVVEPTTQTTQQQATDEPNIDAINSDVLERAPIRIGGSYHLDFTRIDSGELLVDTALAAGEQQGTFIKALGKNTLQFTFGTHDYTCTIGSYTDNGVQRILLTIDLTKYYQELYPTWKITSVVRKEFTSAPYK